MKMRMADRHITWPYLYDGETQNIATKFGVIATPHVFIFDQDRNLRFEGQIDNNQRLDLVNSKDTRNALEELLAGKPVTRDRYPRPRLLHEMEIEAGGLAVPRS